MKEEPELTFSETIKQPFPKLEDVEYFIVEAPKWYESNQAPTGSGSFITGQAYTCASPVFALLYDNAIVIHENSKDFKVTWKLKQTDPHADIKAEYEKAVADGKIVKVFCLSDGGVTWFEENRFQFNDGEYQLRYYNIDWNKLLSWSYANGEFVKCEFTKPCTGTYEHTGLLLCRNAIGLFASDKCAIQYSECSLAKDVKIKDEWLKEIK